MNDQTNIDALLDATLDDLADMPEFKNFPAGAYNGTVELNVKKMGESTGIELKFTNQETVELSDPTQEKPAVGATTNVGFKLDNEYGQGALKNVLTALKTGLNLPDGTSNREVMEVSKGTVCMCVFTLRADKTDKEKHYQGIKTLVVL